jgi:hypothetical protein
MPSSVVEFFQKCLSITPHFETAVTVNFGDEWGGMLVDELLHGGELMRLAVASHSEWLLRWCRGDSCSRRRGRLWSRLLGSVRR